jgi:hypothetical protein
LSREDHRIHDELLLAQRALEKETMDQKSERKRKEKRDLAMALILAIAGIVATIFLKIVLAGALGVFGLLALCGYLSNMEWAVGVSKRRIRLLQGAVLVLGISLESIALYPYWRQEKAALSEADLLDGDQSFNDGQLRMIPPVQVGTSGTIFFQPPGSPPFWNPFPDAEFRAESGKKGALISTTIRDAEGHIVATIVRNHWKVFSPFCADKNYTNDGQALEILDSSLHVVFQLKLLSTVVQVQGEWWDNQGNGKRILMDSGSKGAVVDALGPRQKHNEDLIKPMFIYPSSSHWQEFVH